MRRDRQLALALALCAGVLLCGPGCATPIEIPGSPDYAGPPKRLPDGNEGVRFDAGIAEDWGQTAFADAAPPSPTDRGDGNIADAATADTRVGDASAADLLGADGAADALKGDQSAAPDGPASGDAAPGGNDA
jgi:hypothetical protein